MATRDKNRYQQDSSETRLRVMLEARQHELEAHRQRTSRTFSMILVGAIFLITGAIWLFPASPAISSQAAAMPASPLSPDSSISDSTEDVRFAMQLLNFGKPSATPASAIEARTATKAVAEDATEASIAMP